MKNVINALLAVFTLVAGRALSVENVSPPVPTQVRLVQTTPGTGSNEVRGLGLEQAETPMGKDGSGLGLAGDYQPELLVQNGCKATWAPDGRQLAFGGFDNDAMGLWIFDSERRGAFPVATNAGCTMPAWSPDGRWMAFDHRGDQGKHILRIATAQLPKAPTLVSQLPTSARRDASVHALTGKPVPRGFKLSLLNGGKFKLPSLPSTNVVILDFWATWYGPCQRVMPVLVDVANEYAGRGVRHVAVNLREEPDVIRRYLATAKLDIEVALDKDGRVAAAFEVRNIPTMVIVDRSNIIRKVHVGASPEFGDELRRALDEVLKK